MLCPLSSLLVLSWLFLLWLPFSRSAPQIFGSFYRCGFFIVESNSSINIYPEWKNTSIHTSIFIKKCMKNEYKNVHE